ncbi:hypothetical protein GALL_164340 [mine drainage metagenome]|uniref:Uncharacterized protein n=1 Tax=mine drainage metagenome TaxID=410659 RepID=A0A1J5SBF3_9ZZZZ
MPKVLVNWSEFELGAEAQPAEAQGYLDAQTGAVFVVATETADLLQALLAEAPPDASVDRVIEGADVPDWQKDALREAWLLEENPGHHLIHLADADLQEVGRDLADFAATVHDAALRRTLERMIEERAAVRRFREVVQGTFREREKWFVFQEQRRREKATAWLAAHGVDVEWALSEPLAEDLTRPTPRQHLLRGVLKFTQAAAQLPGVTRIALLGSLTRDEPEPKDADVLVTVSDAMELAPHAKAGRQLAGHAQQLNRGADVFLADERGDYLGRACHWRECAPDIRASCDALHCGRRPYLHDDLRDIRLKSDLVATPPIELWPAVDVRVPTPDDVERVLLAPLRARAAAHRPGSNGA